MIQKKTKPIIPNFKLEANNISLKSKDSSYLGDNESQTTFTTIPKTKLDILNKLPSPPCLDNIASTTVIENNNNNNEDTISNLTNKQDLLNHKLDLMMRTVPSTITKDIPLQQPKPNSYKKRHKKKKSTYIPSTVTPPKDTSVSSSSFSSSSSSDSTSLIDDQTKINEKNIFNSKRMRNRFLSKILMKSKKKIYKSASCFLTPFLLIKLILPELPLFD